MKNKNKNKIISASILAGSMIFSVGCSSNNVDTEPVANNQSFKNDVNFMEDKNSLYGEITSINENNITIALGEYNMPQRNNNPSDNSENKERPEMPKDMEKGDSKPPTDMKNGDFKPPTDMNSGDFTLPTDMKEGDFKPPTDMDMPEMPFGEKGFEVIRLTGEEKVIAVSNDIKISRLNMRRPNNENQTENKENNKQLTLSDLAVGDVIKVNYNDDSTKIESIDLISSPIKEKNPQIKNNTDDTNKG